MQKRNIKINSRKYDGEIHRTWTAELLNIQETMLELVGVFEDEIKHEHLGLIRPKTISYEFYWLDRWFNVFRFHEPENNLRNFYCNINMPPTFSANELNYVDLDIDVVVWKDYTYKILDMAEFDFNSRKYNYPTGVLKHADDAVSELISMIDNRIFPFDY